MDREQVIATLRKHEPGLRAVGVVRLSLFGSTARGDRQPDSDVDLLAAFDATRRISLLDVAAIEIKLSQGAKPGLGGVLPAAKVTPEIAAIRGVEVGRDCVSPSARCTGPAPRRRRNGAAISTER